MKTLREQATTRWQEHNPDGSVTDWYQICDDTGGLHQVSINLRPDSTSTFDATSPT